MLSGTAEFKIFNDHFGKGMDKVSILTRCIIIDKSEERLGCTCYFIYRDSPLPALLLQCLHYLFGHFQICNKSNLL